MLVSDKTPTIATAVADVSIDGNGGTDIDLTNAFGGGNGGTDIDLTNAFGGGNGTLTYKTTYDGTEISTDDTSFSHGTLPSGVSLSGNTLSFDNATVTGAPVVTITAIAGSDSVTHTLNFTVDTIKDQSGDPSNKTYKAPPTLPNAQEKSKAMPSMS